MLTKLLCALAVLLVAAAKDVPSDWKAKIDSYNAFFADDDTGFIRPDGYPGIYLPLLGNGYLSNAKGVRSDSMFISGIFNGETTSPSHRARIPATYAVTVSNSTTLGVLHDIESGVYHRRGQLSDSASWYELRWYAHRSLRSLYVMELDVNVVGDAESVTLTLVNDAGLPTVDFKQEPTVHLDIGDLNCGTTRIPETADGETHRVCVAASVVPSQITVSKSDSGRTQTFVSAYRSSLDSKDPGADAVEDLRGGIALAKDSSSPSLIDLHSQAWSDLWKSGFEISGRPDVSIALNASVYAVLSSIRDDWPHGLAPGGLTNYYNGHSFWDTETWMYPPLLFLYPEISRSLIQYRFDRLEGAKLKAASYNPPFSGTMFPWESAFSGVETCPTFAATGLREDHISGDISYAVWQEWAMREDINWLREIGYPILTGVADFWMSFASFEYTAEGKRIAHLNDVIPPDEYVDHVNDSVYTNFVAAQALRFTVKAAEILNATCDKCAEYAALAEDIVIIFDDKLGIHPEYSGYKGDIIKQADVVLLHYPLEMEMSEEVVRADLEYYSPRTDIGGPAMTWGMHSIGYLDLQDYSNAAKFFNMSFQDNMHAPLQVWTETPDGNAGNFITGAGGFLQTVISGYAGLRVHYGSLQMTPQCPEGVTYLKIRSVSYLGNTFDYEYSCGDKAARHLPREMILTLRHQERLAPRLSLSGPSISSSSSADLILNQPLKVIADFKNPPIFVLKKKL